VTPITVSSLVPLPDPHSARPPYDLVSVVLGLLLVGLGGWWFLLGQVPGVVLSHAFWPFFTVPPAVGMIAAMALVSRRAAPLAIPASIVTVGLITRYFESWAYAWALVPTVAGVGQWLWGVWEDDLPLRRQGQRMAAVGVTLFLAGAAFFELVINPGLRGNPELVRIGISVALIVAGAYLLLSAGSPRAGR
jgi:hypothetical protein